MAYVELDIDLDQFDTNELVDELIARFKSYGKRKMSEAQKDQLKNELFDLFKFLVIPIPDGLPSVSIDDQMKAEVIKSVWNKYTSWQFEERLK